MQGSGQGSDMDLYHRGGSHFRCVDYPGRLGGSEERQKHAVGRGKDCVHIDAHYCRSYMTPARSDILGISPTSAFLLRGS